MKKIYQTPNQFICQFEPETIISTSISINPDTDLRNENDMWSNQEGEHSNIWE